MRLRVLELPVHGLPPELDGLRIAHLSDFHLGVPSRGGRAVERAVDVGRRAASPISSASPATCSRGRADERRAAARCSAQLPAPVRRARQPRPRDLARPVLAPGRARPARATGRCSPTPRSCSSCAAGAVELAGVDPRTWMRKRPSGFADPRRRPADPALPLPARARHGAEPGRWDLILAGHLHAGQIVLPYGFGKLLLAHPRRDVTSQGVFRRDGTTMHVSPGLGTTFVPFRFFARPEATELVLRCG